MEGDTPVTQQLKTLQGRLVASAQRLDETLAQRKTFEQIAKRLREERLGLQNRARVGKGPSWSCADTAPSVTLLGAQPGEQGARPDGAHTREP